MPKQKINKIIIFISFIFIFSCCHFFPVKAEEVIYQNEEYPTQLDINVDTTWHKDDNLTFNKKVTVYGGVTLTIEKGAQIKFGKNEIDNSIGYLDIFGGRVIANGTQDEPIKISAVSQSDKYLISFDSVSWDDFPMAEPSFLRYVEISGGGYVDESIDNDEHLSFLQAIIPPARAFSNGNAAFKYASGKVHLENCRFNNNDYADVGIEYDGSEKTVGSYLEIINSNFEKNGDTNEKAVIVSNIQCINNVPNCVSVLLKNNWYGGELGPIQGSNGNSKEISGELILDGWRTNSLIADPVIIIPGIMGSTEVSGQLKLDPILHIYDDLLKSLITNGYKKDSNLFEFLYDWRKKNSDSAILLKAKVESIISSTKISKVDLVAHSMGGLIARSYVENEGYQNIDQLITLGTPHRGSPEAYLKWEAGEGFFTLADKIARNHFEAEAKHGGYESLFAYILDKVPSTKELLPDYSYLYDANKNSLRTYYDDYPRNTFLENLNAETSLENLKKIDFTNIIGVTSNSQSTISKINIVNSTISWKWNDGMPNNFYDESTNKGLEYNKGDETVPERSAEDILANKTLKTNSTHNNLPTVAQCAIFQELTGIETECKSIVETHIPNILLINIFSPIDIQLIDPNGKKIGRDFEISGQTFNEIPGAFYSGYDTENEFITIPNPIDGEYKIAIKGTGSGEYKIEVAKISEADDSAQSATESVATFTGAVISGTTETVNAIVNGDSVRDKNQKLEISPEVTPTTIVTTATSASEDDDSDNDDNHNKHKTKTADKNKKNNSTPVETFLAKDNRESIDLNSNNPLKNANNVFADTDVAGAENKTKTSFNKFWIILGIIICLGVGWLLMRGRSRKLKLKNKNNGFMLIEALTLLFIFALIMVTFYSVFTIGIRYIQDAKNRLGALAVANEKMEIIRNLKYDNIGTIGGTISGNIPQDQTVVENTRSYQVHTQVSYVDDPYDGLAYADTVWFEDYKKVIVTVSWSGVKTSEEVELISRFVPPGKEVAHAGDGILSVNIFTDQSGGAGVAGSRVQIVNPDTGINTYEETSVSGNVSFMGSTVANSIQKYQITVTKDGYETVVTFPPYPITDYNPIDVHASVVTGVMNVKNIVQNKLANMKISTVDYLDRPISGVPFHLVGGRKLGTKTTTPFASVYNFDQDSVTDSGGEKLFSLVSPGGYVFSLIDPALTNYKIISIAPAESITLLSSDETLNVKVKLASNTTTALSVVVLNDSNDIPIAGAKVRATNTLGYDQELTTTTDGKVFFPVSEDLFVAGNYNLKITAEGFSDSDSSVTINTNELKTETKKLTAS